MKKRASPTLSPPSLYLLSVIASGTGFVTQMLVSGFWSTAFSHDVLHFSVNLAFYFLSLGIGSLLSNKFEKPTTAHLIGVTLGLALWTGLSLTLLRVGILFLGEATILPILVVSVAGALAGIAIPLTLRIGEKKISLAVLLFLDYAAAILFTLLFTFVLLIPFGYGRTSLIIATVAALLCAGVLVSQRHSGWRLATLLLAAALVPYPSYLGAAKLAERLRNPLDETRVIASQQSHYQKIVLTEEKGTGAFFPGSKQHVLYLDGFVQFSSLDEQTYHACLANIPEAAAEFAGAPVRDVLILGGGDGLAARNLLAMPKVRKITLVELDPAMIQLALTNPVMRSYNLDALKSPRIEVVIQDAFKWVQNATDKYDLILIDFPHPKSLTLARLYSAEFFRRVFSLLKPKAFAAIQSGPSMYLRDPTLLTLSPIPAVIRETARAVGMNAHIYVSPRDEEAFVLATPDPAFSIDAFTTRVGMRGLAGLGILCSYNPEWKFPSVPIRVNTLNTLTLSQDMLDWYKTAGKSFFNYRGSHGIFLPE